VNSEELEQSLRAEFESYLKGVFADMREDVTEFQSKIDAELEKHRSQLDEAFQGFVARFNSDHEFDAAFRESVVEHLRLARDEGAKITATAIAEAEELEKASSPNVNLADIKEAINEISSKDSQSSILKSLIHHAANFTPRGAFFIIKNEQFVGWKLFGKEGTEDDSAVREIHFPVASDTVLGAAVRSQAIAEGAFGTYSEDVSFLDPLHFGSPDRMYAIPLVARGRGVAVLYADYGHEGVSVNTDALEMLVRVAGLTVEMLASAKAIRPGAEAPAHAELSESQHETEEQISDNYSADYRAVVDEPADIDHAQTETVSDFQYPAADAVTAFEPVPTTESQPVSDFSFRSTFDMAPEYVPEVPTVDNVPYSTFENAEFERTQPIVDFQQTESPALDETALSQELGSFEPEAPAEPEIQEVAVSEPAVTAPAIVFDTTVADEPNRFEASPFDQPAEKFEPATLIGGPAVTTAPVVEKVVTTTTGSRLSDRNVDLPIEVADDERRLHNDARRFARLLVSEIKLYNEKKVQEGRESNDLYERLREAIDRSREMYNKRVQPPVASKFDYFHYELVNALAEGDIVRLGSSYPGANV